MTRMMRLRIRKRVWRRGRMIRRRIKMLIITKMTRIIRSDHDGNYIKMSNNMLLNVI